MRFKTIRDLLEHLGEAHQALAKLYHRLVPEADAERTRMMLHYLVEHEQKLADEFAQYLAAHNDKLLDTWFDKARDSDFEQHLQRVSLAATATQEDVLALALKLDNRLLEDIEALLPLCPSDSSRELLSDLVKVSHDRQHQLVHQTQRMYDL